MNSSKPTVDPDEEQPTIFQSWLNALSRPGLLIHAIEEVFNSCIQTRPWRRLLIFSPALLLVACAIGLIVYGRSISRDTLVRRYGELAEAELARLKAAAPKSEDAEKRSSVLMAEEETSTYSDMLYRRLLKLNDESARTRYLVAVQMARSQRIPQARRLMEEIAPLESEKGYAPAHAWLSIDLLSRQPLSKEDQGKLLDHLSHIQGWDGAGSGLLAIYANLLANTGKRTEALEVMRKAAAKDPGLQSAYSIMARRFNVPQLADEASVKARSALQAAIKKPNPKLQDFIQLASLELTEENFQEALQVTRTGLNTLRDDNEQLKYLGSEALRLMYRKSVRKTPKGLEFNLNLLDLAMKEFPANPNLSTEIALLDDMGVSASAELKAVMEQQLAEGKATALAHLILANQCIKAGRLIDSIPHLELTLKSAPNHPVALNNLSLALALTDASKVQRSEELIDQAIKVDGRNPELYDSQGQIRIIAGRPLDAVESLEKAISIDPNRVNTRELMVKAYREAGLEDLAKAQEKSLVQLKAEAAKKPVVEPGPKAGTAPAAPAGAPTSAKPAERPQAPKPKESDPATGFDTGRSGKTPK